MNKTFGAAGQISMSPAARVALVHIGKTGGNSVLNALSAIFPSAMKAPFIMQHQPDPTSLTQYRLIAGHFGYSYAAQLNASLITVLRDPAERVISLYHFWQTLPERESIRGMTFDEFLQCEEPSVVTDLENAQVWQIAHDHRLHARKQLGTLTDDEIVARAIDNLDRFCVVGLTENLPLMQRHLGDLLGLPDLAIGRINVTANRPDLSELGARTRELIEHRTHLDRRLYDYATQLVNEGASGG